MEIGDKGHAANILYHRSKVKLSRDGCPALQMMAKPAFNFRFLHGAQQGIDGPAFLEEDHGGCAHDVVLGGGQRILLYVHFPYFDTARIFRGELIEYGVQSLAVTAHGRIVFHENRARKGENFLVECVIGNGDGVAKVWNGSKRCMALATFGLVIEKCLNDPVFCATL